MVAILYFWSGLASKIDADTWGQPGFIKTMTQDTNHNYSKWRMLYKCYDSRQI